MNILNKLTIKHLTQNKKRTIVTIIGVILSTALMVGIGLLFSTIQDNSVKMIAADHGSHHVMIKVPHDKIDVVKNNSTIKSYKYKSSLGYAKYNQIDNIYKPYIEVFSASKEYLSELKLVEGRLPQNDKEIVVSKHLITNGNVPLKVSDKLTLEVGKRVDLDGNILDSQNRYLFYTTVDNDGVTEEYIEEKIIDTNSYEYTIVGIVERDVLEPYESPGYSVFTIGNLSSKLYTYITYKKVNDVYDNTNSIIDTLGISKENIKYNDSYLAIQGVSAYDNIFITLASVISIVLSLVSIACVIVIYNSFAISVMERKKQFGLFSSIGATKSQLRHTVFFEAFIVGLIGIPLGIASAYLGIGIVLKIINYLLPEYFGAELALVTNPIFIIIPIIFMIITIIISAYLPAKMASRVSPIQAIRQNDDIKIKSNKIKSPKLITKIFGIEGELAYKNMKRNKKKYRITIVSLFISIVLFISFSSLVKYGLESSFDFVEMPKFEYATTIRSSYENRDKINELASKVTANAKEYVGYTSLSFTSKGVDVKYSEDLKKSKFYYDGITINNITVIGLDNEVYEKYIDSLEVKENTPIVINKFSAIDYSNNQRKAVNIKMFDSIDKIDIAYYNYEKDEYYDTKYTFNNIYLTEEVPMGIEVDSISNLNVIVSEDVFNTIYDSEYVNEGYAKNLFLVGGDYKEIDKILSDIDNDLSVYNINILEEMKLMSNIILVVKILLYGFISLVTLIGVTSVLNTINTSMALRRGEFAVLRSIGLTPHGFNKILFFESIFFGLKSLLYGLPVSIFVTLLLHNSFSGVVEFNQLLIPWNSILIAIIGVFVIVLICMWYSSIKIKHENILEAIRDETI